jgi:hypothetical protein
MQVLITAGWGPVAAVRLSVPFYFCFLAEAYSFFYFTYLSAAAMYFVTVTRDQTGLMTGR